jgi:hypothetical protein
MAGLPLTAAFPQSGSIISRWKLDEASGTRADNVGSNTLQDNNTVTSGTGRFGDTCADFEAGNTEWLSIADASQTGLDIAGVFSFGVHFKLESLPASGDGVTFMSKMGATDGNESFLCEYRNNGGTYELRCYFENASNQTSDFVTAKTLSTGVWYHIVFAMNVAAPSGVVYLDGVSLGAMSSGSTNATTIRNSTCPFTIGYRGDAAIRPFDGLMQDFVVWSAALTAAEAQQVYMSYFDIKIVASSALVVNTTPSAFNVGTADNRILLVGTLKQSSQSITGVTYGGVAMTKIATYATNSSVSVNEEQSFWVLINPASGSNNIALTSSGGGTFGFVAACYSGVDQTTGYRAVGSSISASSSAKTISVTTVNNNAWVAGYFRMGASTTADANTAWRPASSNVVMADSNGAKSPAGAYAIGYTTADSGAALFACELIPFVTSSSRRRLTLLGVG